MVKNRTGMSKRSENSFIEAHRQHHFYCKGDKMCAASMLDSMKVAMANFVTLRDRQRGWRMYLTFFPAVAARARRLILKKKMKYVCNLPVVGTVYRVLSQDNQTYTVYSDKYECECRYYKLLCEHKKELTCEHILACVIAHSCKLVPKPENDRVRQYLGLPSKNENIAEIKFPPYESDNELIPDQSSGSDADSTSDEDFDKYNSVQGPLTWEEQNVEYSFKE